MAIHTFWLEPKLSFLKSSVLIQILQWKQLQNTDHLLFQKIVVWGKTPNAQSERFEIMILFFSYVLLIPFSVYHLMIKCVHSQIFFVRLLRTRLLP